MDICKTSLNSSSSADSSSSVDSKLSSSHSDSSLFVNQIPNPLLNHSKSIINGTKDAAEVETRSGSAAHTSHLTQTTHTAGARPVSQVTGDISTDTSKSSQTCSDSSNTTSSSSCNSHSDTTSSSVSQSDVTSGDTSTSPPAQTLGSAEVSSSPTRTHSDALTLTTVHERTDNVTVTGVMKVTKADVSCASTSACADILSSHGIQAGKQIHKCISNSSLESSSSSSSEVTDSSLSSRAKSSEAVVDRVEQHDASLPLDVASNDLLTVNISEIKSHTVSSSDDSPKLAMDKVRTCTSLHDQLALSSDLTDDSSLHKSSDDQVDNAVNVCQGDQTPDEDKSRPDFSPVERLTRDAISVRLDTPSKCPSMTSGNVSKPMKEIAEKDSDISMDSEDDEMLKDKYSIPLSDRSTRMKRRLSGSTHSVYGNSTSSDSVPQRSNQRRSKRVRCQTQIFQSPIDNFESIPKSILHRGHSAMSSSPTHSGLHRKGAVHAENQASASTSQSKSTNKNLTSGKTSTSNPILFYKNEFLAVRNEERSFFVCQAGQNVYRTSKKLRIRWFSADHQIYTPDFYDSIEFDSILTSLSLRRMDRDKYKLSQAESRRARNILDRALAVESGALTFPLDNSVYGVDISQLNSQSECKSSNINVDNVISPDSSEAHSSNISPDAEKPDDEISLKERKAKKRKNKKKKGKKLKLKGKGSSLVASTPAK